MAYADYRLCDICASKAFYDANLAYESAKESPEEEPFRVAGEPQCTTPELAMKCGSRLGRLGDWAVICLECAKTYRTQIVMIEPRALSSATGDQP